MGVTWKTPEQATFLASLIPTYLRHVEGGKRKEFWTILEEEWFKRFPLEDPPADLIEKEGSAEEVIKAAKKKKIVVSKAWIWL